MSAVVIFALWILALSHIIESLTPSPTFTRTSYIASHMSLAVKLLSPKRQCTTPLVGEITPNTTIGFALAHREAFRKGHFIGAQCY